MGDERKDQNLPARPASSLMGQLVRQRQASEVAPAQQQQTNVASQGQQTGVGGAKGAAPPPGGSGMNRSAGPATGVQGQGGAAKPGGLPAAEGAQPSRADIERIDARDETDYGHRPVEVQSPAGDLGAKFSANQQLIREREKVIIDQLRRELDTSRLTNISEDTQA